MCRLCSKIKFRWLTVQYCTWAGGIWRQSDFAKIPPALMAAGWFRPACSRLRGMNLVPNLNCESPSCASCGRLRHKLNSAALYLLSLPGRRCRQVRNHGHRTLGIAVHRRCLFQRHHHRCSLTGFHVRRMGMLPCPRDYNRSCFADATLTAGFALISGSAES